MRVMGASLAALALGACSSLRGDDDITVASYDAEWSAARTTELESHVAKLESEKAALAKQVFELQKEIKARVSQSASGEAVPTPEANGEMAAADNAAAAPPVAPAAVVAAADVNRALANSPAPPVVPGPRLVQPSFASEQETVFENEASTSIKTASVLYGVHLASYRQVEDARAGWRKLQRDNPDELGLLEPRFTNITIEGRGDFVRLIGGGLSSPEKAQQLCSSLRTKGVFCTVTSFEGESLPAAEQD
ncbi:MAG: SPOR domain-containing protein [Parvularculaceae bacterium]